MKITSFGLAAIALALMADNAEALPAIKAYKGVSPYKAHTTVNPTMPPMKDPRAVAGARRMRLSSNEQLEETYLDELHYIPVNAQPEATSQFWTNVEQRLESAIDRLDKATNALGIGNAISPYKAANAVKSAVKSLGFSFSVNSNKGTHGPDFTFNFNMSEPMTWGEESELSSSTREGMMDGKALPNLPSDSGFNYTNDTVRGVNLGNWLLFEAWMDSKLMEALNNHAINTPSANPIIDEWTAGLYSDKGWASYVLQKHFDEWVTEDDFKAIKAANLNHVRIPVPYFMFKEAVGPNAPYLTLNRFAKLKQGVILAKKYGLKVWIDLHGVPGSQNGFDNSGHSGSINWASNASYYTQTQYAFSRLVTEFTQDAYAGTVTAIEAVNEPKANVVPAVQTLLNKYYPWARNTVAIPDGWNKYSDMLLVIHDGFQGLQYWQNFWTGRARKRVLLDTHPYFVYSDWEHNATDTQRLQEACNLVGSFQKSQQYYPSIAGEWNVNGPNGDVAKDRDLPVGPIKFPSGPSYPYSVKYMAFMARNFKTQQWIYEQGGGWIHWSWRNDNYPDWSYKSGLKYGWIPSDLDEQPFGSNPCASIPSLMEAARNGTAEASWAELEASEGIY
ncbi:related to SPR1 - exo-1,3-beta-glucanase precursor [Melanopsichium pennsylvanicum]|uniref:Related to SPR1 - exo-1,3-beta-glucanase n=2 Tax=Melanopsichium pennsylvanicum TaxID=63383 RepID=A0AAJ4XIB5_9BASI|nr:related to SPR1-exo-1,3-beta-glucanase precursor [Melanopsichium pennsylvanicum 4]SNX82241.1 related to SPR1 - exo-1,3-beta-glucanase precursor [Melanopsichium pennsylvanicum]